MTAQARASAASGCIPSWEKGDATDAGTSLIPGFPAEPDFKKEALPEKDYVEDEDEDISTDLTDADERWLERHQD